MSAYKRIKVNITDRDILVEALSSLGLKAEEVGAAKNLRNFEGNITEHRANIIARREQLNEKFTTGVSNDLGFHWNAERGAYDIICSEYDAKQKVDERVVQAYAKVALEKVLASQRFALVETTSNDQLRQKQQVKIKIRAKKVI